MTARGVPSHHANSRSVARAWSFRAGQELGAAAFFDYVATELAQRQPAAAEWAARSADKERKHGAWCAEYAASLDPASVVMVPARDRHLIPQVHEHVLAGFIVAACAINETLAAGYLSDMRRVTSAPRARKLVRDLLVDEMDHGRFGWVYLSDVVRDGETRDWISANLDSILEHSMGAAFRAPRDDEWPSTDREDEGAHRLGHLSVHEGQLSYLRGFDNAILPGFQALGIDCVGAVNWRNALQERLFTRAEVREASR